MPVKFQSSPFGNPTRTRVLLALNLLSESYARELSRIVSVPLSTVQRALVSLERDGLVAARSVGRTRVYRLDPRYFARSDLEAYLRRLTEPEDELLRRVAGLRRRPRRTSKPL